MRAAAREVGVTAANGCYRVLVGRGLQTVAAREIAALVGRSPAFVVADANVPARLRRRLLAALADSGVRPRSITLPAGEDSKSLASYERLCTWLMEREAERTSAVVALGGGVVGDVAGFVAATYQRGVALFQLPTTLLAMVDASVGGKVAVNLAGRKNMLGSFHQPQAVYADLDALESLDGRQMRCGLAECVKHGILSGEDLFGWTVSNNHRFLSGDEAALVELVARNVAFKAGVVERDPTERSVRALLNLGHTFGHAIERLDAECTLGHGEAVSIGMVAACHFALTRAICPTDLPPRVEAACRGAGLPVRLRLDVDPARLVQEMRGDKKSAFTRLRLIVPRAIGDVVVEDRPSDAELVSCFEYVMGA